MDSGLKFICYNEFSSSTIWESAVDLHVNSRDISRVSSDARTVVGSPQSLGLRV